MCMSCARMLRLPGPLADPQAIYICIYTPLAAGFLLQNLFGEMTPFAKIVAHGSWLVAFGSWLVARGKETTLARG